MSLFRYRPSPILVVLLALGLAGADEPRVPPLTAAQQQRLKERDQYAAETAKLRKEGKLAEAIAVCEKMLAIEREVFGNVHKDVAGSLEQLAEIQEEREEFAGARKARVEVLAIQTRLWGEKNWQVTDARLALEDLDRLTRLDPVRRRKLAEATQWQGKATELYRKGKWPEATSAFQEAMALYKVVWGRRTRPMPTA
jgi:tetratricopeptide (TPR) repeat protein